MHQQDLAEVHCADSRPKAAKGQHPLLKELGRRGGFKDDFPTGNMHDAYFLTRRIRYALYRDGDGQRSVSVEMVEIG